jgi:hypothetical protein
MGTRSMKQNIELRDRLTQNIELRDRLTQHARVDLTMIKVQLRGAKIDIIF